jgi:hypothetical protein
MRRRHGGAAAALVVLALLATTGMAFSGNGSTNNKTFEFSVALWGDLPYNDVQAETGVPNLVADINNSDIAFSVHDGDLKAGSAIPGSQTPTDCSDAMYEQALNFLNAFERPAFFTPGDNDWTDCDRTINGPYDELERLQHERSLFFSNDTSFGKKKLKTEVQTAATCLGTTSSTGQPTFATACVENRRWTFHDVVFATLNVQGTCNNRCSSGAGDPAGDEPEFQARNAADIQWLQQTFQAAKEQNAAGVMLIAQADPGWDLSDVTRAPLRNPRTLAETDSAIDGYQSYLLALRNEVAAFKKPVAYVHGDSHYFRIDKPLQDAQGRFLENFTRVETFGDNAPNGNNSAQWVKALIDPHSRDVFAFQAQIVSDNRVAVPAP